MINGLGVLGWGVGGIEAEAVDAGAAALLLAPEVVGFRLHGAAARRGRPPPTWSWWSPRCCASTAWWASSSSSTARACPSCPGRPGDRSPTWPPSTAPPSASSRSTTRRCTTCGAPARPRTWSRWSSATPRSRACSAPTAARPRVQRDARARPGHGGAQPGRAQAAPGPGLPWPDCRPRSARPSAARKVPPRGRGRQAGGPPPSAPRWTSTTAGQRVAHGAVVIAAITSCTNTSNPSVMVGAGLVAKKAVERGLDVQP